MDFSYNELDDLQFKFKYNEWPEEKKNYFINVIGGKGNFKKLKEKLEGQKEEIYENNV